MPDTKPSVEPVVGPISKATPHGSTELRSSAAESKVATRSVRKCWNGARPPCKPCRLALDPDGPSELALGEQGEAPTESVERSRKGLASARQRARGRDDSPFGYSAG